MAFLLSLLICLLRLKSVVMWRIWVGPPTISRSVDLISSGEALPTATHSTWASGCASRTPSLIAWATLWVFPNMLSYTMVIFIHCTSTATVDRPAAARDSLVASLSSADQGGRQLAPLRSLTGGSRTAYGGPHPMSKRGCLTQPPACASDTRTSRAKSSVQRLARSTLKNCRVLVHCDPLHSQMLKSAISPA